jgi:hypothetical protein
MRNERNRDEQTASAGNMLILSLLLFISISFEEELVIPMTRRACGFGMNAHVRGLTERLFEYSWRLHRQLDLGD